MEPNDDSRPEKGNELVGEHVRIYQRGKTWHANFQHGKKQHRVSLKTTNKKVARRLALKIEVELSTGQWKPMAETATIDQAIVAYRESLIAEERAPRTITKYYTIFERVAELACERKIKNIAGIDLKFVDVYKRIRTEAKIAAKTRYTEIRIIRQLVNFALSRDMIASDPLKGLKNKKPKRTSQPCWTLEQVNAILAASPEEIRVPLTLLAETGMRFGEMSWLTWDDVDVRNNVIKIQPKAGWKPKTGDERAVPLSPKLLQVLASLSKRWRWVVTMPPTRQHQQPGRQWAQQRLLEKLKRALKILKLPGKLHTFRHSFISNALMKGTPTAVVREWIGHVSEEMIRYYTHVHNEESQLAMQRLARANHEPQQLEKKDEAERDSPAQSQHTRKENDDANDAK